MYGSDPLGLLTWRFFLDQAGYGVSSDILSHSVALAQFLVGPIERGRRDGGHDDRRGGRCPRVPRATTASDGPEDPTGEVENEDFTSMLCRFEGGATGTFEASRTVVGPESQNAFEVYGTKGSLSWNHERINELQYYTRHGLAELRLHDHLRRRALPVPRGVRARARPTASGSRTSSTIQDFAFLEALATGARFSPGFAEAVDVVSVQQALIDSWAVARLAGRAPTSRRTSR